MSDAEVLAGHQAKWGALAIANGCQWMTFRKLVDATKVTLPLPPGLQSGLNGWVLAKNTV